ncbi:MAG: diguanylate cyclase domain-containing protein [Acidimicrobiales bacterium]
MASPDDVAAGLSALSQGLRGRVEEAVAGTSVDGLGLSSAELAETAAVVRTATIGFAQWLGGASPAVARGSAASLWSLSGRLTAGRSGRLKLLVQRCLRWRDSVAGILREEADRQHVAPGAFEQALAMLGRSLDVTLVRIAENVDGERRRIDAELARQQQELAFQATHDPLTGLPNRTLITDRAERMLARARRNRAPVAAFFIDLDNFKTVNDTFGHAVGDELLKAVTERLTTALRESDTLGRLGGDEFVVLAEGMGPAGGPELLVTRLAGALRDGFVLPGTDGAPVTVSASIGIAIGDRPTADALLRDADIAMYSAKFAGKNRYAIYHPAMKELVT